MAECQFKRLQSVLDAMPSGLLLLVFLVPELGFRNVGCGSWKHLDYSKQEGWGGKCLMGRAQSPINLFYKNLKRSKVEPLAFINYNNVTTTVCNNGHSVVFKVDQECEARIAAGGLKNPFFLDEVQFHWGSEHTLKDKRYPLEMHLIHYNSHYPNKSIALCHGDGLAIIGVLFCASSVENIALNPIISALEDELIYRSYGNISTVPDPIHLQKLLPYDSQKFFRYQGSLTTPPCSEVVIWTVMEHVSYISKYQLQRFCRIRTKTGSKTNFRGLKPLNNRKLYLLKGGQLQHTSNILIVMTSILLQLMMQFLQGYVFFLQVDC